MKFTITLNKMVQAFTFKVVANPTLKSYLIVSIIVQYRNGVSFVHAQTLCTRCLLRFSECLRTRVPSSPSLLHFLLFLPLSVPLLLFVPPLPLHLPFHTLFLIIHPFFSHYYHVIKKELCFMGGKWLLWCYMWDEVPRVCLLWCCVWDEVPRVCLLWWYVWDEVLRVWLLWCYVWDEVPRVWLLWCYVWDEVPRVWLLWCYVWDEVPRVWLLWRYVWEEVPCVWLLWCCVG